MVVSKNKKAKESLRKYLQRENAALEEATKSIKNEKSIKMIPFFACNMHVKTCISNFTGCHWFSRGKRGVTKPKF
jgi:hypothetical protein